MKLDGLKVIIMGLGYHGGGVAAARYCAQSGATVTVTDLADAPSLAASLEQLEDVPIERFTLGRHDADDFRSADVVVVNPAVRPDNELVQMARRSGAAITSESELFLDACPAMVIGVTGTVGKSTTAAMLAAILNSAGRRTWLGGNIGRSLLPDLPQMHNDEMVVLELSSFQLYWLSKNTRWPRGAIVTNCYQNHLDWHGIWKHYVASKQRLVRRVPPTGFAILNASDAELESWRSTLEHPDICTQPWPLEQIPQLKAPGEHNRRNAACAAAAAEKLGVDTASIRGALANFVGLPHRLAFIGEVAGRQFYNDSKSTTPAATLAALKSVNRPIWLLLGGADQRIDDSKLIVTIVHATAGAAMFGSTGRKLQQLASDADKSYRCFCGDTLQEAFHWCWKQSQEGDVILLSPAYASTDQFRDFTHRGEEFERLVKSLRSNQL